MNTQTNDEPAPQKTPPETLPRYVAGENFKPGDGKVRPYVILVPSGGPVDEETLMRTYVQDVLNRNGVRGSAETLGKLVDIQREANGKFDFDATREGINAPVYGDHRGPTDNDLNLRGRIGGHTALMSEAFQSGVISNALSIEVPGYGAMTPEDSQKLIDTITGLKNGAAAMDNGPLKEALDTMENVLKNKQDGNPVDGMSAGFAALKFLAEAGKASGLDDKAFEVFGKFAKGVGVPMDIYKFGENTLKMANPNNGLSAAQRVEAATEAAENMLSIGEAFGTKTPLMVPIMAIRMQAMATELGVKAINATAERDLNDRLKDGSMPLGVRDERGSTTRIEDTERRIRGMPINESNALGTCIRIIDTFKDSSTQDRFIKYLAQRIEPDSVVTALVNGKDPGLSPEKLQYLAERMKGMASGFMKAEKDITESIIVGDGAGRFIKEYGKASDHLKIMPKPGEIVDLAKPVPEKRNDSPSKLFPEPKPFDPENILKPKIEKQITDNPALRRALPTDPDGELPDSLARAYAAAGLRTDQPVQVVLNNDRTQLIAFQGDGGSGMEKRAQVNVQQALNAPLTEPRPANDAAAVAQRDIAIETPSGPGRSARLA